jgi:Xaa-Pro aminopeptidase
LQSSDRPQDLGWISERTGMAAPRPRLQRVTGWLAASKLDALVVTGPALVNWLTGYSRYHGGPSAAVLTPAGERTLVVVRDETAPAEQLSGADHVVGYSERGFGLELGLVRLLLDEVLRGSAVSSASRIAVAGDFSADLAADQDAGPGAGAEWIRADAELHRMSLVKDADEIGRIFHAYELCWLAHAALAEGAAAGASEIEMMSAAQAAAQIGHGSPVDFVADVLAGANTAEVCAPVAIAGRTRPGPGEPVIADISVGADGYWADTCRTYLNGSNTEVEEMRGQLAPILAAAAAELRTGATGAAVFGGMRRQILTTWPDGEFPHHGGHGVGLTVFDDPHVIPSDSQVLESWMVMALEPGVYLPGRFGVRRENLFLVTPDGAIELAEAVGRPLDQRAQSVWRG